VSLRERVKQGVQIRFRRVEGKTEKDILRDNLETGLIVSDDPQGGGETGENKVLQEKRSPMLKKN